MKAVLLIACICIASAAAVPDPATGFVRIFGITEDEARHCINKTNVVRADLASLEDEITELSEDVLLKQANTRRAICAMTCAAQAQGTMIGAKMNPPKMHDVLANALSMPDDVRVKMHEYVDICAEDVKNLTDDCEAGLRFITCVMQKHHPRRIN